MSKLALNPVERAVQLAVSAALGADLPGRARDAGRIILAVSGGVDSMTLLDAAAALGAQISDRVVVATFDHGTGPAATAACDLVEARASTLGLQCVRARARSPLSSEADFRDARFSFLHRLAAREAAAIATAHTASDQVETVVMRVLRGAGARGLAGLFANERIVRPLLAFERTTIETYARARQLTWVEDPSNASLGYLRNRVRHELLPALRRVRPTIDSELLLAARAAARWRRDVDAFIDASIPIREFGHDRGLDVDAAPLAQIDVDAARSLWPAILARASFVVDRRGIERLAAFGRDSRVGARIPLTSGWQVIRSRDCFQLRASDDDAAFAETTLEAVELSNQTSWGDWSFRVVDESSIQFDCDERDHWLARLPADRPLSIRPWRPGDSMPPSPGRSARKVKHLLSAAGVTGHQRAGWPVVLAGDQIVWVPGVRRSDAAAGRADQAVGGLTFACDYFYRDILRRPAIIGSQGPTDRLSEGRHR